MTKELTKLARIDSQHAIALPNTAIREQDSIAYWLKSYWETKVEGSPKGTVRSKRDDLQLFLNFFGQVVGSDHIDDWTPSISKSFKTWLQQADPDPPRKHMKSYAPSSINRMLATLRHFAKFIGETRKFEAGSPFDGVRDITMKQPEWDGLPNLQIMRLRAALDQITKISTRKNQSPLRDRCCFIVGLATGLRASEIVGLNLDQYQGKYFVNVKGKGESYRDVYVSSDAREELDRYIEDERGNKPGPLFLTNRGGRLIRQQMDRFFKSVAAHANAKLPQEEQIDLHAHRLRHTSTKRLYDKKGPLEAKKFSGHRSFQQLERYATQTREEHEKTVDEMWG